MDAAPSGDPMMINQFTAETREIPPIELVTAYVRVPDSRLIALLTKPTPLTVEEWAYIEAVETSIGAAA